MELNSAQQLHTLDSQQLEDDINKLLHIKTIKPSVLNCSNCISDTSLSEFVSIVKHY